jgi:hypothetical protein
MSNKKESVSSGLLVFIVFTTVPCLIFHGFALQQLWLWFMVPLGVVHISIGHSLGISAMIGGFTGFPNSQEKDISVREKVINSWAKPLGVLLFGYLFHYFM